MFIKISYNSLTYFKITCADCQLVSRILPFIYKEKKNFINKVLKSDIFLVTPNYSVVYYFDQIVVFVIGLNFVAVDCINYFDSS